MSRCMDPASVRRHEAVESNNKVHTKVFLLIVCNAAPVFVSQTFMVPSIDPDVRYWVSGEKAVDETQVP